MGKPATARKYSETPESSCNHPKHENHTHVHGPTCGHKTVKHDDHVDYEHDGHYHRVHGDHVDECPGPKKK